MNGQQKDEEASAPTHFDDSLAASRDATADSAAENVGQVYSDVSQIRLLLSASVAQLLSREAVYKCDADRHDSPTIEEVHTDCLQLASDDIECEKLRATCATLAIQAEASLTTTGGELSRELRWRQMYKDVGRLWLEHNRVVERLTCRMEAAFLRLIVEFSESATGNEPSSAVRARKLLKFSEDFVKLSKRLEYSLSIEFELCCKCLQRILDPNSHPNKTDVKKQDQEQQTTVVRPSPKSKQSIHNLPYSSLLDQYIHQQQSTSQWLFWLIFLVVLVAVMATILMSAFRFGTCWDWDDLRVPSEKPV